jgi:hypothetical protein
MKYPKFDIIVLYEKQLKKEQKRFKDIGKIIFKK